MVPSSHTAASAAPDFPVQLPALMSEGAGYMVSTLELCAGLDVQDLPLSTLPHDTLRELLRLRGSWQAVQAAQGVQSVQAVQATSNA